MKGYSLLINKFDAFNTGVELSKRRLKDVPYLTNSILFLLDSLITRAVFLCLFACSFMPACLFGCPLVDWVFVGLLACLCVGRCVVFPILRVCFGCSWF